MVRLVTIRRCTAHDVPWMQERACASAWSQLSQEERFQLGWPRVSWHAAQNVTNILSNPSGVGLVAVDGNRLVGYFLLAVTPEPYNGSVYAYLADIWIEPEYRRTGVAELFHRAADAYTLANGLDRSRLWVSLGNERAIRNALKNGFRPVAQVMERNVTGALTAAPENASTHLPA